MNSGCISSGHCLYFLLSGCRSFCVHKPKAKKKHMKLYYFQMKKKQHIILIINGINITPICVWDRRLQSSFAIQLKSTAHANFYFSTFTVGKLSTIILILINTRLVSVFIKMTGTIMNYF